MLNVLKNTKILGLDQQNWRKCFSKCQTSGKIGYFLCCNKVRLRVCLNCRPQKESNKTGTNRAPVSVLAVHYKCIQMLRHRAPGARRPESSAGHAGWPAAARCPAPWELHGGRRPPVDPAQCAATATAPGARRGQFQARRAGESRRRPVPRPCVWSSWGVPGRK